MPTESLLKDSVAILVPFQITGNGGVAKAVGEHAILRQMLIGVLMTNHSERVMFPRFGANVQGRIFDPKDDLESSSSASDIAASLQSISPLLSIGSVTFRDDPQEPSAVFLEIQYAINNNSALLRVRFLNGIVTDEEPLF